MERQRTREWKDREIQKPHKRFDCDIETKVSWHGHHFTVTVSEDHRCPCPGRAKADRLGRVRIQGQESLNGFLGPVFSLFSNSGFILAFGLSKTIFSSFNKVPVINLDQIKLVSTGYNQRHNNICNCKCLCLSSWTMSSVRVRNQFYATQFYPKMSKTEAGNRTCSINIG